MEATLELQPAAPVTLDTAKVVDVDQLDTAKPLEVIFAPYQTTLDKWKAKVDSLTVTDISQKTEMEQAGLARLELKKARCTMEQTRKGAVEHLKARTAKIDTFARTIRVEMEDLEEKLKASEEFAERFAAKQKADLKLRREQEYQPLIDTPILGNLSDLTDEAFGALVADAKMLRQAKADAAAKAEADRIAKEAAEKVERERVAADNERLKAEAAEAARLAEIERKAQSEALAKAEADAAEERRLAKIEADRLAAEARKAKEAADAEAKRLADIAAKEKAALEAKLADERKAAAEKAAKIEEAARKEREAAEAKSKELAAKAAAEQKRLKDAHEAKGKSDRERDAKLKAQAEELERAEEAKRKAAAAAPDAEKLKAFAFTVRHLVIPTLNNVETQNVLHAQTEKFAIWIESQIAKL